MSDAANQTPIKDDLGNIRHGGQVFYRILDFPTKGGSLQEQEVRATLANAFGKWQMVCNFEFYDVDNPPPNVREGQVPHILFTFADELSLLNIAECTVNLNDNQKTISFDKDTIWTDLSGEPPAGDANQGFGAVIAWAIRVFDGKLDLLTVACHEIGHALGLGHNEDAGSIMQSVIDSTKAKVGWMAYSEIGMVDAASLGKIYELKMGTRPTILDTSPIEYFHWVGGVRAVTDGAQRAKPKFDPAWGMTTAWWVPVFGGFFYPRKDYWVYIDAYLEPSNSQLITPDTPVVCGGYTIYNGAKHYEWGHEGTHPIQIGATECNPGVGHGDDFGYVSVWLAPLSYLRTQGITPLRIKGGRMIVGTEELAPSPRIDVGQWGSQTGAVQAVVATGRTYFDDSKQYHNAYGMAVIAYDTAPQ